MNNTIRRAGFSALVVAPLVALLVACAPTPAPAPAPAPAEPSAPSTPAPPAKPTDSGTAVGFTCDEALPLAVLADLPGAWAPTANYTPTAGSNAARAAGMDGIACGYTNTSGQSLEVGIAEPSAQTLASIKEQVSASSTVTEAFGTTGYFTVTGGAGDAEVFPATYWISAVSPAFAADTDAKSIISSAIQVLPAG